MNQTLGVKKRHQKNHLAASPTPLARLRAEQAARFNHRQRKIASGARSSSSWSGQYGHTKNQLSACCCAKAGGLFVLRAARADPPPHYLLDCRTWASSGGVSGVSGIASFYSPRLGHTAAVIPAQLPRTGWLGAAANAPSTSRSPTGGSRNATLYPGCGRCAWCLARRVAFWPNTTPAPRAANWCCSWLWFCPSQARRSSACSAASFFAGRQVLAHWLLALARVAYWVEQRSWRSQPAPAVY